MVYTKIDQPLRDYTHAILDKTELNIIQTRNKWNWKWISNIKAKNGSSALWISGADLSNLIQVRAEFKDKVPQVSDS